MKTDNLTKIALAAAAVGACVMTGNAENRALWGSLMGKSNGTYLKEDIGKLLLSWRMMPGDNAETAFDLYQSADGGLTETKLNGAPIKATNFQPASFGTSADLTFRLTYAGQDETIGSYTISKAQLAEKLPYISIPLKGTEDVCTVEGIRYGANDASVGDLDGDGEMEIVVKRLRMAVDADGKITDEGTGGSMGSADVRHNVIWDAYKLDGTFMWRVMSGPSIILGNSSSFAIADFDGDGKAEMVIKTGEGTVFGDGTEIGDTDGDGKTDYRTWTGGWVDHYNSAGPEFFSVIDGATGKELARADYIYRDTSEAWGDGYWKRANSHRLGVAWFSGEYPSIFIGRGVYARTVCEGWDYRDGRLTRRFHFDTATEKDAANRDGRPNSAYAAQGNHSFNAADLDGDGKDEVMYGSMALDDDGHGLWSSRLGHGDANHVGKFLPDREGLQVFHCLESGKTNVALHDAATGEVIWNNVATADSDCGRCLVADLDPASPGCEFWWAGSNAYSADGKDLGYKPKSCNMAIWFDGSLNRQLLNETKIDSHSTRVFTMYRYDLSFNNGTKSNPSWYGDILGDWREEIIAPDATKVKDIKIFSTWIKTDHRFPWLMTDHTYQNSALNQNVGYNQPNNLGYYLGSDLKSDSEAWANDSAGVEDITVPAVTPAAGDDDAWYNLQGQRVANPSRGLFIHNGKKVILK